MITFNNPGSPHKPHCGNSEATEFSDILVFILFEDFASGANLTESDGADRAHCSFLKVKLCVLKQGLKLDNSLHLLKVPE